MISRWIAKFLGLFAEVRTLRQVKDQTSILLLKVEQCELSLRDKERALEIERKARLSSDQAHEFLHGELEALKNAHAGEIDGLKRIIDFFAPHMGGRTVFGLAPEPTQVNQKQMEPQGAQTRRSLQRNALDQFLRQAEELKNNGGLRAVPDAFAQQEDSPAPKDFSFRP